MATAGTVFLATGGSAASDGEGPLVHAATAARSGPIQQIVVPAAPRGPSSDAACSPDEAGVRGVDPAIVVASLAHGLSPATVGVFGGDRVTDASAAAEGGGAAVAGPNSCTSSPAPPQGGPPAGSLTPPSPLANVGRGQGGAGPAPTAPASLFGAGSAGGAQQARCGDVPQVASVVVATADRSTQASPPPRAMVGVGSGRLAATPASPVLSLSLPRDAVDAYACSPVLNRSAPPASPASSSGLLFQGTLEALTREQGTLEALTREQGTLGRRTEQGALGRCTSPTAPALGVCVWMWRRRWRRAKLPHPSRTWATAGRPLRARTPPRIV
jgi:hypothetical protein